jgi:RNA polymerase sigma-70 factor (ECF subfamily)
MVARPSSPSIAAVVPDDGVLITQAIAGDDRAFSSLYKRHARYLAGVVYRLAGNDSELEDVLQEAFCDAAASLSSLRDPAGFRAWLVRIAIRRLHARFRGRRRWHWLLGATERLAPTISDPRARQRVDQLYEVLDTIPLDLRTPWILHVIEGQTLPEVADACGVSLATVKRRIADAEARISRGLHAA